MRINAPDTVTSRRAVLVVPLNGSTFQAPRVEMINEYDADGGFTPDAVAYRVLDMHGSVLATHWTTFEEAASILLNNSGWADHHVTIRPEFR